MEWKVVLGTIYWGCVVSSTAPLHLFGYATSLHHYCTFLHLHPYHHCTACTTTGKVSLRSLGRFCLPATRCISDLHTPASPFLRLGCLSTVRSCGCLASLLLGALEGGAGFVHCLRHCHCCTAVLCTHLACRTLPTPRLFLLAMHLWIFVTTAPPLLYFCAVARHYASFLIPPAEILPPLLHLLYAATRAAILTCNSGTHTLGSRYATLFCSDGSRNLCDRVSYHRRIL